eukprot:scaffold67047_cov109-Phaeocystis_antarctica.AAC.1
MGALAKLPRQLLQLLFPLTLQQVPQPGAPVHAARVGGTTRQRGMGAALVCEVGRAPQSVDEGI